MKVENSTATIASYFARSQDVPKTGSRVVTDDPESYPMESADALPLGLADGSAKASQGGLDQSSIENRRGLDKEIPIQLPYVAHLRRVGRVGCWLTL